MTFVENHDVGAPPNRYLAYAFIAAYPGYPIFANVDIADKKMSNLAWIHPHRRKCGDHPGRSDHDHLTPHSTRIGHRADALD